MWAFTAPARECSRPDHPGSGGAIRCGWADTPANRLRPRVLRHGLERMNRTGACPTATGFSDPCPPNTLPRPRGHIGRLGRRTGLAALPRAVPARAIQRLRQAPVAHLVQAARHHQTQPIEIARIVHFHSKQRLRGSRSTRNISLRIRPCLFGSSASRKRWMPPTCRGVTSGNCCWAYGRGIFWIAAR